MGLYPLIYLHSEQYPRHLPYTDCPTSVPPLLAQWFRTSSFYGTVGIYPLIFLHSGHHPGHLLYTDCPASVPPLLAKWDHNSSFNATVGLYPLILCNSEHHLCHLLCADCPASVPPFLVQGAYISSFLTRWAYTHLFSYTVGTTLAIYCTHTVQPHFPFYLHSRPIHPHFMIQWAYTPFTYPMGWTVCVQ